MSKMHSEITDRLFNAILNLESVEECYSFFEDLCTIKEVMDISQRLEIALLLNDGKSYQEVAAKTGVSTATISRVNRCLRYGSGGYKTAINKLKTAEEEK